MCKMFCQHKITAVGGILKLSKSSSLYRNLSSALKKTVASSSIFCILQLNYC